MLTEFQEGGAFQKPNFLNKSMTLIKNSISGGVGGGEVQTKKKTSIGGVWIFSRTQYSKSEYTSRKACTFDGINYVQLSHHVLHANCIIVLATVFSMTCYQIVMQCSLVRCHGICHS